MEVYRGVSFINSQEGWVVGDYGLILYTTDGGTTWAHMEHPSRINLVAVHAAGPGLAWMAGDGGLILHYSASEPPGYETPTPTATPTATVSATPTGTSTNTPIATASATASPTGTATPTATQTATVTPSPTRWPLYLPLILRKQ